MGSIPRPNALPSGLVTFLFTDIEGSTRLAHTLGDAYRQVLHDHRHLLRQTFMTHTGTELLTEGDSFFVAFAEANVAMQAALDVQRSLKGFGGWPTDPNWRSPARPKVRIGIHSGWATPDHQGYATSAVHRAARVCAAAHGDQVLCSQSTIDAARNRPSGADIRDLGLHRLRGFDDTERLFQLSAPDLPSTFPPPAAQPRHHNIPADPDEFIGRESELIQLSRLVAGHRLTTVTALPQTGKTRLVRTLARHMSGAYRDGVWYAALRTGSDAATALAAAMGVRGDPFRPLLDTIVDALRNKACLLVLDDADATQADCVTRVLSECPKVTVLVTARQPLGLAGEVKWALPTMRVCEAARLLRRRAIAATGGSDPGDCAELARKVDGFPPAINVLARTVGMVGVIELARRLQSHPFTVLDAQRELSSILDDAYARLQPRASQLLRAMAALPQPAGVDEAERLCGGSSATLNALIELVDASFVDVQRTETGAVYRLPAPVRWYADAKRLAVGQSAPELPVRPTKLSLPKLSWANSLMV